MAVICSSCSLEDERPPNSCKKLVAYYRTMLLLVVLPHLNEGGTRTAGALFVLGPLGWLADPLYCQDTREDIRSVPLARPWFPERQKTASLGSHYAPQRLSAEPGGWTPSANLLLQEPQASSPRGKGQREPGGRLRLAGGPQRAASPSREAAGAT